MNYKSLIATLVIAACSAAAHAVPANEQVMASYQAGLQGDANANTAATTQLAEQLKANPTDALTLALLGSSEPAGARYAEQPWEKMQLSERGLARLDKALKQLKSKADIEPAERFQVLTTAGCTFIALPPMFNRFDQGYQLLNKTISNPGFAHAPARSQVRTLMCGAQAAVQAGDKDQAKQYITSITSIAPQGPHMAMVDQLKSKLGE